MVGVSGWKLRRVMDLVRGKPVQEAELSLKFMASPAAGIVLEVIKSAAANAEHNDLQSRENLKVVRITADNGPRIKRFRPKARGRVGAFDRPTSHITVEVGEG